MREHVCVRLCVFHLGLSVGQLPRGVSVSSLGLVFSHVVCFNVGWFDACLVFTAEMTCCQDKGISHTCSEMAKPSETNW